MHIAEGILPAEWAVAWAVPAAAGAAVGLHRLATRAKVEPSAVSLVGLMGAAVFAISLMPIPVPVAGSVSHPAGTPLAAIVVGPMAGVVLATVSLLIQALFFAHGGLTTLGANVVSEGLVGSFVGFGIFWMVRRGGGSLFWAGFAAGFLGDLAVYMTTAVELALGLFPAEQAAPRAIALFLAFLPTQLPLAILEGVLTGGILRSLAELRPDVAGRLRLGPAGPSTVAPARPATSTPRRWRSWWRGAGHPARVATVAAFVVVAGLAVWGLLWAVAVTAGDWVGLDEGVMERVAAEQGREAWRPLIDTDRGDLLLYVFFLGAVVAGTVIGWIVRGMRGGPAGPRPPVAVVETPAPGRRRLGRTLATVGAGVVGLLVVWAWAAPGLGIGPVSGADIASWSDVVLHPSRQQVLSARGGDAVLFAFMVAGLALGLLSGWMIGGRRRRRLRLRLPHLHLHDVRSGDLMTWESTGLQRVDARLKTGVVVLLLVVNLVAGWMVSLVLLAGSLALLLGWQRVRLSALVVRLVPALIITLMLVVLRGFSVAGRALFTLDLPGLAPVGFTGAGVAAGLELGIVVLAGVALMLVLGLTTPLPALLSALRWFRVPELLVEIGMLMYRYLFLFVEETGRMRQAQRLRGPQVSWSKAMGGFGRLGAHVLIRSYDRSQRVYDAQRLRGAGAPGSRGRSRGRGAPRADSDRSRQEGRA